MNLITKNVLQQNLGAQSVLVLPAPSPALGFRGLGEGQSLVKFGGCENDPQMVTASIFAFADNFTPISEGGATPGPVIGKVNWASGNGQAQEAYFDIPIAMLNGLTNPIITTPIGGTQISLPCSTMEVSAFNAGNQQVAVINGAIRIKGQTVSPARATASVAVGSKTGSRATYTDIIVLADARDNGLQPGTIIYSNVPAFAESFTILCHADPVNNGLVQSPPIGVSLNNMGQCTGGGWTFSTGQQVPVIPLPGATSQVSICNNAATGIGYIAVCYFLRF